MHLVKKALAEGHCVTAYGRDHAKFNDIKSEKFKFVTGQLEEHEAIEKACQGQDAVLCALGSRSGVLKDDQACSRGTRAIIEGMKKTGVKRIVVCSSWGVGPGNREHLGWFIRTLLTIPLADKDIQEADIEKSGLTYTFVRPPRLLD